MELINLLRVLRRWVWLIVAVVVVTELALWLGTRSAKPMYAATVSLQISSPQSADVAAYDEYRSISLRDEITTAINNFIELAQSDEVHQRVNSQLGLEDENDIYTITAEHMTDSDFVNVTVEAETPSLAAEIANTHVSVAIAYYGELRAKTTNAEKDLFAEQLRVAEQEYQAAEKALADFRAQNGIYSLENQMSTQQKLLEQLQLDRDQRLLDQAATAIAPTTTALANNVTQVAATPAIDLVAEVDKLIAQRQKELDQFTALAPQYNVLSQNVDEARADYQHLLSKYSEAQLKVTAVQAANFIQVVKPAFAPAGAESSWPKLAVLALAGSLGLGVVLAFIFQYISDSKTAGVTIPMNDQKTTSPGDQNMVTQGEVSKDAVDGKKTPPRGKRSRRKTRSTDAEQEPSDAQDQHTSTETPSHGKQSRRKTRSIDVEQEPTDVQDQHTSTETQVA